MVILGGKKGLSFALKIKKQYNCPSHFISRFVYKGGNEVVIILFLCCYIEMDISICPR